MELKHILSKDVILIAIKNKDHQYLLYYDKDWKCEFFPHYPMQDYDNEEYVKENISKDLNISKLKFLRRINKKMIHVVSHGGHYQHVKYNPVAKEDRLYNYTLYDVIIDDMPQFMKTDFECNGKKYCWRTIDQMFADDTMRTKNRDIINFVGSFNVHY